MVRVVRGSRTGSAVRQGGRVGHGRTWRRFSSGRPPGGRVGADRASFDGGDAAVGDFFSAGGSGGGVAGSVRLAELGSRYPGALVGFARAGGVGRQGVGSSAGPAGFGIAGGGGGVSRDRLAAAVACLARRRDLVVEHHARSFGDDLAELRGRSVGGRLGLFARPQLGRPGFGADGGAVDGVQSPFAFPDATRRADDFGPGDDRGRLARGRKALGGGAARILEARGLGDDGRRGVWVVALVDSKHGVALSADLGFATIVPRLRSVDVGGCAGRSRSVWRSRALLVLEGATALGVGLAIAGPWHASMWRLYGHEFGRVLLRGPDYTTSAEGGLASILLAQRPAACRWACTAPGGRFDRR